MRDGDVPHAKQDKTNHASAQSATRSVASDPNRNHGDARSHPTAMVQVDCCSEGDGRTGRDMQLDPCGEASCKRHLGLFCMTRAAWWPSRHGQHAKPRPTVAEGKLNDPLHRLEKRNVDKIRPFLSSSSELRMFFNGRRFGIKSLPVLLFHSDTIKN